MERVHQALLSISVPIEHASAFVSTGFEKREWQFTARSPFVRKPLLQLDEDSFAAVSMGVLSMFMRHAVFATLRAHDPDCIGERHGYLQEAHVGRGLEHLGFAVHDEAALKRGLSPGEGVADFACDPVGGVRLVVDSKAVAPNRFQRVNPTAQYDRRELRKGVIKALCQCLETAYRLDATDGAQRNQLLVVTREEFLLGNGPTLWREHVGKALHTHMDRSGIPQDFVGPADVAVVSLETFDRWVGSSGDPAKALATLTRAADACGTPDERLTLEDHIPTPHAAPPYLQAAWNQLFSDLAARAGGAGPGDP